MLERPISLRRLLGVEADVGWKVGLRPVCPDERTYHRAPAVAVSPWVRRKRQFCRAAAEHSSQNLFSSRLVSQRTPRRS